MAQNTCNQPPFFDNGTGAVADYTFGFEYINRADVEVYVGSPNNWTQFTEGDASNANEYQWQSDTVIRLNAARGTNNVLITRETDRCDPAVEFFAGTSIRAEDLNSNQEQTLFLIQELAETLEQSGLNQPPGSVQLIGGDGIDISNGIISADLGNGLEFDASQIQIDQGEGLEFNGNELRVHLDSTAATQGLQFDGDELQLKPATSTERGGIRVGHTLTLSSDDILNVASNVTGGVQFKGTVNLRAAPGEPTSPEIKRGDLYINSNPTSGAPSAGWANLIDGITTGDTVDAGDLIIAKADSGSDGTSLGANGWSYIPVGASTLWETNGQSGGPLDGTVLRPKTSANHVWMQSNAGVGGTQGAPNIELYSSGSAVFNQSGGDADFRVESDSQTHMLFVDGSTNRVGIGTNAPQSPLHVIGTSGAASLTLTGGNANTDITQLNAVSASNVTWNELEIRSQETAFDTAGTERMRISSSGIISFPDDAALAWGSGSNRPSIQGNETDDTLIFNVTGNERMRIDSRGRLLIGTKGAFASQNYRKLQIGSADGGWISLGRDVVPGSGNHLGAVQSLQKGSDNVYHATAGIEFKADGTASNTSKPSRMEFHTTSSASTTRTERMRIDSTGQLSLLGNGGSSTNCLDLKYNGSAGQAEINAESGGGSTFITFGTSNSGTLAERMRIASDGRIILPANSPGIAFNANDTSGATVDSKSLDDYEEGTFVPFYSWVGGGGNVAANQGTGRYTKIGDMVYYRIHFNATGQGDNFANALGIGNLPFRSANDAFSNAGSSACQVLSNDLTCIFSFVEANSTFITLRAKEVNSAVTSLTMGDLGLDGATARWAVFTGFYRTTA